MADAQDLKSWGPLKGRVGSSPTTGTELCWGGCNRVGLCRSSGRIVKGRVHDLIRTVSAFCKQFSLTPFRRFYGVGRAATQFLAKAVLLLRSAKLTGDAPTFQGGLHCRCLNAGREIHLVGTSNDPNSPERVL
jgi:hypothetical protein